MGGSRSRKNAMNIMRRPLILDLDFTLLHLERQPDSIEVPGRTRSAWIAPPTVELLRALQAEWDLVIATARSWDGTRWVWDGLAARGVAVSSLVIEDGARLGHPDAWQMLDASFETEQLRAVVEARKSAQWPAFAWQHDFQACLVARCENTQDAAILHHIFAQQIEWRGANLRFFRDGRKVYLLSRLAGKWSALQKLLNERAPFAAGVGDGENDVGWLMKVKSPCTLTGAVPSVVALVQERQGYLSPHGGHDGIADVLRHLLRQ